MDIEALDPVVAVPAVLEIEDRIAGPVTFRMAGYLALAAAGAALCAAARRDPMLVLPGVVLAVVGLIGALCRPGGRPVESWLLPLLRYRRRHRRRSGLVQVTIESVTPPPPPVELATEVVPGRPRRWPAYLVAALVIGLGGAAGAAAPSALSRFAHPQHPQQPSAPAPPPVVVPTFPTDPRQGVTPDDPTPWFDCGC